MALRSIELRKQIDDKKKALARAEERIANMQTRKAELADKVRSAENDEERTAIEAEVTAFNNENDEAEKEAGSIRTELATLEAELDELEEKQPSNEPNPEERTVEKMNNMEIRSSEQYNAAFLRGIKDGNYEQCRSLLTEGAEGGQVMIPVQLENEIRTAWENSSLMSLVKTSYFKGNVKVGFELSATGATVHVEGTAAPTEEVITLGTVEIKNEMIKKWITVSDEALEGTTVSVAEYLYKEIAHKIIVKAEEILVAKIIAQPAVADATHPGVAVKAMNPAAETIMEAVALLCSDAQNIHIAMNRQTYPAFVKIAMAAGYAIDVFDGLKDRIVFTDALKAFSAATAGKTDADGCYAIVGDFSGAQANKPNGDDVKITVDPYSLSEKDLVKLVGRQYVGIEVVAPKHFVKLCKVTAA